MPNQGASTKKATYSIASSGRHADKENEHYVRVLRDGKPVREVVVVSTSSSSAYFRNSDVNIAKRKG